MISQKGSDGEAPGSVQCNAIAGLFPRLSSARVYTFERSQLPVLLLGFHAPRHQAKADSRNVAVVAYLMVLVSHKALRVDN
jgi:hypothetical protein